MIAADPLAAISLVGTFIIGALGGVAALRAQRNERKRVDSAGRIDLLGASQASLKEALDRADAERERADAENDRLRAEMLKMRNEYDVDRLQWKAKGDAQDREMDSLRVQMRACQESLALLSHNSAPAKDLPHE